MSSSKTKAYFSVTLLFGAVTTLVVILLVNKREGGHITGLEELDLRRPPLGTGDATPVDSETTVLGPASAEDASAADGHQHPKVCSVYLTRSKELFYVDCRWLKYSGTPL